MGTNGSYGEREGRQWRIQAGYGDRSRTKPDPREKNYCRRGWPRKKATKEKRNPVEARSSGKLLVPKGGEIVEKGGGRERGKRK